MQMPRNIVAEPAVTVVWEKDGLGRWYALEPENLDGLWGSGICIVWCEGAHEATICVAHGSLPERLHEICEDRAVSMYRKLGTLRFTWAELPIDMQRGAARFLTEQLGPVFEDRAALVPSVPINLPE